jgi:hypothetical protein
MLLVTVTGSLLEIGTGTIALGTFSGITWENGPFLLKHK